MTPFGAGARPACEYSLMQVRCRLHALRDPGPGTDKTAGGKNKGAQVWVSFSQESEK